MSKWSLYVCLENIPKQIRALIGSKSCFYYSIETRSMFKHKVVTGNWKIEFVPACAMRLPNNIIKKASIKVLAVSFCLVLCLFVFSSTWFYVSMHVLIAWLEQTFKVLWLGFGVLAILQIWLKWGERTKLTDCWSLWGKVRKFYITQSRLQHFQH